LYGYEAPQAQTKLEICEACQDSRWCGEGCWPSAALAEADAYPATNSLPLLRRKNLLAIPLRLPRQTTTLILATSSLQLLRRKRLLALPPRLPELTAGLILATSSLLPLR